MHQVTHLTQLQPLNLCALFLRWTCRVTAEWYWEICAELWLVMADWSLLGNFLEEVQEHSTSIGKVSHKNTHITTHTCTSCMPGSKASDFLCTWEHIHTRNVNQTFIYFHIILFILGIPAPESSYNKQILSLC